MKSQDILTKIIITPLDRLHGIGFIEAKCARLLREGYEMMIEQDTMNWIFTPPLPI